ncbi:MAG: hypothetical protein RML72_11885 [Bacteroidia bacterium]|nr:hypothetical protein [Bacteroidia bacterium]MDW8159558.1 hypothetical protein [Bacteroidia bacterium]
MRNPTLSTLLLKTPVDGYNLGEAHKLGALLGDIPVLFIFLRRLGGIFCLALIAELKAIKEQYQFFPEVVFIYGGTPEEGALFFERHWRVAKAIADPNKYLFYKFEVKKATYKAYLNPHLFRAYIKLVWKYSEWKKKGTSLPYLTTLFLLRKDEILWRYTYNHLADIPSQSHLINNLMPFLV